MVEEETGKYWESRERLLQRERELRGLCSVGTCAVSFLCDLVKMLQVSRPSFLHLESEMLVGLGGYLIERISRSLLRVSYCSYFISPVTLSSSTCTEFWLVLLNVQENKDRMASLWVPTHYTILTKLFSKAFNSLHSLVPTDGCSLSLHGWPSSWLWALWRHGGRCVYKKRRLRTMTRQRNWGWSGIEKNESGSWASVIDSTSELGDI